MFDNYSRNMGFKALSTQAEEEALKLAKYCCHLEKGNTWMLWKPTGHRLG